ncbi:MAG: hypothetical protein F2667_13280 [Actinobacteria bacterium]|uniref:Unannotated protein n=1 Tax=freshwater metagenome TaxID=449393 RepID=A0A6J6S5L8_9ZZZZ|nr:hypothetical protein [Actinomycetota bacterium]
MATRILLTRHGLADYETSLVTDEGGCLTSAGRTQVRGLAARLRSEGVDAIWCSPLSRAAQSAEILAAELGIDLVTVREDLREYSVGALAGTDQDEAAVVGEVFGRWVGGDDQAQVPGGETVAAVVARVMRVVEEVAQRHAGRTAVVVSHGGAISAAYPALTGRPREAAYDLVLGGGCSADLRRTAGPDWAVAGVIQPMDE